MCYIYRKIKASGLTTGCHLGHLTQPPQCNGGFSWVAVMHAMRVMHGCYQTNTLRNVFRVVKCFLPYLLTPILCPVSTKQIQHCSILSNICFTVLYTPQPTGNFDFTYMVNCFSVPGLWNNNSHCCSYYPISICLCFCFLGVFQSGWHCGESLQRPLWSFLSVKIAVLCDVLIGH